MNYTVNSIFRVGEAKRHITTPRRLLALFNALNLSRQAIMRASDAHCSSLTISVCIYSLRHSFLLACVHTWIVIVGEFDANANERARDVHIIAINRMAE